MYWRNEVIELVKYLKNAVFFVGGDVMNAMQQRFFEYLAGIQEDCVEICMIQHKCSDEHIKSMLYEVTYEVVTSMI